MLNKVALITGATRGIGKAISLSLARQGYNIVVTGKSIKDTPNLPGSIYSVSNEIEKMGVKALPIKLDVRNHDDIKNTLDLTKKNFGRLDVVVNNAGALYWNSIENTDIKKYNLINDINCRGSFFISKYSIPLMLENDGGHIIMQSPPLPTNIREQKVLANKTAYMISKWGMTLGALGIGEELKDKGIAVNTLWPSTAIESHAVINNNLGEPKIWRKPDIIVDTVNEIIKENPDQFTCNQLIDEVYLRGKGYTDFEKYQCVEGYEPPLLSNLI